MPGYTAAGAIPYPIATDPLDDAVSTIPKATAERVATLIGGISPSILETPWYNISSLLINGYTGIVRVKRSGITCCVEIDGVNGLARTNPTALILPAGFRPATVVGFLGNPVDATGGAPRAGLVNRFNNALEFDNAAANLFCSVMYFTNDAFPAGPPV